MPSQITRTVLTYGLHWQFTDDLPWIDFWLHFHLKCLDMSWGMAWPLGSHSINLGINLHPSAQVSCCCILPPDIQVVWSALSRCKVLGQMAKHFHFKCWDMNWEMGQPDPLPHGINLGINLHPSSQVSCCCILPMATQLVRSLWTDARCRVSWPYATIWAWKCNAVCNIWLAWNPLWRYLMLQFSHSLNPMARQNNFILVSHSYCSHLCMLHSSQAELQRKKSELARLQQQVLKVSTYLPPWHSSSTHLYFCSLCMTNDQRASHLLLLVQLLVVVSISRSPQRSLWGLALAETCVLCSGWCQSNMWASKPREVWFNNFSMKLWLVSSSRLNSQARDLREQNGLHRGLRLELQDGHTGYW